jgi:hypothetical protein
VPRQDGPGVAKVGVVGPAGGAHEVG